ncbi:MAG: hypothetical protein ACOWWO_10935 [Peptococcaceae bacterium]
MNIRRIKLMMIILFLSLVIPVTAFANSAPVYLEKYPGFNIAPKEDSPLKVEHEQLTFKIAGQSSDTALVSANYAITNTSSEQIVVPMVFPFISATYRNPAPEISFNGNPVRYQIYSGGHVTTRNYLSDPAGFSEQVSIDKIIEKLNRPQYKAQYFNDTAQAVLYKITFNAPTERQAAVNFKISPASTRIMALGFSGYEIRQDGNCAVFTHINEKDLGKAGYILVLGEDTLTGLQGSYKDTIEKTTTEIKGFITENLINNNEDWPGLTRRNTPDFYSRLLEEIDSCFEKNQYVFNADMLLGNIQQNNNISVLLYELAFEAESTGTLLITYPVQATIDRRKSNDYVNTFAYILNPAQKFARFKALDIQIELNSQKPFLIDSSIPFTEIAKGTYTASFNHLPDQDLIFSTYSQKEITFWDSTTARILPKGYGRVLAGFVLAALLPAFFLAGLYKYVKNRS